MQMPRVLQNSCNQKKSGMHDQKAEPVLRPLSVSLNERICPDKERPYSLTISVFDSNLSSHSQMGPIYLMVDFMCQLRPQCPDI